MPIKSSDFLPLNDGIVRIYATENTAEPGDRPTEKLLFKYKLKFDVQTVGQERYYNALQNNVRITKVIRCPLIKSVNTQDIAIIENVQYRIAQKQEDNSTRPQSMVLSLVDIEEVFEL